MNLIAFFVFNEFYRSIIQFKETCQHFENIVKLLALPISFEHHIIQGAKSSISDECLDVLGEFVHKMRCGNAADRPTVHADLSSQLKLVYAKLKNPLCVDSLLVWIMVIVEDALL